jgi:release factor glutamine methyltransferase
MKQIVCLPAGAMTKISLKQWLVDSAKRLRESSDSPMLEARLLMMFVLNKPHEWLITHFEDEIEPDQLIRLDMLRERLVKGEPIPYLVGRQAFFGLDFIVTPDVLIPRPETEIVVEEAIAWLEANPGRRKVADVGTGSGIIAISLADHFIYLRVIAIENSPQALLVAHKNAITHKVDTQISFLENDLLSNVSMQFDLIVANLPYIPSERLKTLNVRKFEPLTALDGGQDGFQYIGKLLEQVSRNLFPGGMILLEIDVTQTNVCVEKATVLFPSAKISIINDLSGKHRVIKIQT